jgi:hypothetical protein
MTTKRECTEEIHDNEAIIQFRNRCIEEGRLLERDLCTLALEGHRSCRIRVREMILERTKP